MMRQDQKTCVQLYQYLPRSTRDTGIGYNTSMLYLIGTPIGNLDDLSFRQARTIMSVDILLAEDTRSAGLLLKVISEIFPFQRNPNQRMISYYKEKEFEKLPEVMDLLEDGTEVGLISQAGMPVVSDPGYLLIKTVIQKELPFTVIPGPSAVTTALLHSGLKHDSFMFVGFLPKKKNQLMTLLQKLQKIKQITKDIVFVAFESPNRIKETLNSMNELLPNQTISVSRELTKKFEETKRGTARELLQNEYKGEITIVF